MWWECTSVCVCVCVYVCSWKRWGRYLLLEWVSHSLTFSSSFEPSSYAFVFRFKIWGLKLFERLVLRLRKYAVIVGTQYARLHLAICNDECTNMKLLKFCFMSATLLTKEIVVYGCEWRSVYWGISLQVHGSAAFEGVWPFCRGCPARPRPTNSKHCKDNGHFGNYGSEIHSSGKRALALWKF